jgi:RNA polymerase sigma-70 factor (ECF subfamily)
MIRVCLRYAGGSLSEAGALYNAAMLRVFRKIGQFRNEGEIMGWVRRIVVTVCIDNCRAQAPFSTDPIEASSEPAPVLPDIYNRLSGSEILELVHRLPKNTGLVFNLFVMEGYRHEEIGKLLGISGGTSKWHLNEARRLLRQKLELLFKQENLANAS